MRVNMGKNEQKVLAMRSKIGSAPTNTIDIEGFEGLTAVPQDTDIPHDPRSEWVSSAETEAPDESTQAKVEDIRREIKADPERAMAMATRHPKRKSIALFYKNLPEDIVLAFDFADVCVSPRISYNEMMDAVQWIVTLVTAGRPFVSEPIKKIVTEMAIVKFYTDLQVDEGDELLDQYDILANADIIDAIIETINPRQREWIMDSAEKTVANIIAYQNSAAGIISQLNDEAAAEDSGLNKIMKTLTENKDMFEKMTPLIEAYQDLGVGASE